MKKIITILFLIGLTGFLRPLDIYTPQMSMVMANTFDKTTRMWLLPPFRWPIIGSYWYLNALSETSRGWSLTTHEPSWVKLVNGRVQINLAEEQVLRKMLSQPRFATQIKNHTLCNHLAQYRWHYVGVVTAVVAGYCLYKLVKNKKSTTR